MSSLRAAIGKDSPVIVCGSTAEGEEEPLLAAFKTVQQQFPAAVMILAPRHPERFEKVAALIWRKDLPSSAAACGNRRNRFAAAFSCWIVLASLPQSMNWRTSLLWAAALFPRAATTFWSRRNTALPFWWDRILLISARSSASLNRAERCKDRDR